MHVRSGTRLHAIAWRPGPKWVEGRSVAEQDLDAHRAYFDRLHRDGMVLLAGPFADVSSGGLALITAEHATEARAIMAGDPAIRDGVFVGTVRPLHVVFGDRAGSVIERIDAAGEPMHGAYDLDHACGAGEGLHRAFRPRIGPNYRFAIERILSEGAGLTHLVEDDEVRALALWRVFHTTYCGRRFEIDDLVTDERHRSRGLGATLLGWLELRARELGCPTLTLNSANHRADAHRFYRRQGYEVIASHFSKRLDWAVVAGEAADDNAGTTGRA